MTDSGVQPDPRSGLDEAGRWSPAFEGQREPFRPGEDERRASFESGNTLQLRHGAYSPEGRRELKNARAEELRALVPAYSPSDEPMIRLVAGVLARIELAWDWLDEHGIFRGETGELQPVLKALSTWENTAGRLLDRLGCDPSARGALGLDLALAARAASANLEQLRQQGHAIVEARGQELERG